MRNPGRKAVYCGLALLVATGLILLGIEREPRMGEPWRVAAPIALGFAILPFPLYILIEALFACAGLARLRSGVGVIARWTVQPGEWAQFGKTDPGRGQRVSTLNHLWIRGPAGREPVEVIVGETSLVADGSYHSLKPGGLPDLREVRWLEGSPACLEFALRYPRSRYGPPVPVTVRVPVPAGARGEAGRVLAHYQQILRPKARAPSRTRRIAVTAALAGAAGAGGYALLDAWRDGSPNVVPGLMIGGIVLAIFAALFGLVSLIPGRRA